MAGIMDMFRPKPSEAAAPINVNTNTLVPTDQTLKSDGTGPKGIPAAGEGDKSPLDAYAKLWEADKEKDGVAPNLVQKFNIDPKKLMEQAGAIDFTSSIDPKDMEAATKGDKEAFERVLNKSTRLGFAHATNMTANIVEKAINTQAAKFKDEVMPYFLKQNQISQDLTSRNELFSNPAIAPMLEMAKSQMAIKYPKEPAEVIAKHAEDYIMAMSGEILKASGKTITEKPTDAEVKKLGQADTDWGKFFEG